MGLTLVEALVPPLMPSDLQVLEPIKKMCDF